ncbi:hypothetical protein BT96DRAFT_957063 [Gymnopus androsaceus JB14]|uniref:DDE Tnp4 domain-containing protein n=1 Tax=Gymnopus androsaceus JB14 TaxID=1447944 RepID=A0A6A4HQW1_9AGAR|nr:hypothetical protein BT96DRAFT_957063 [Gymnopus androsaceus JB14]
MYDAQIQWPEGDEFVENEALILTQHPLLEGAFGSIDGLNLPVQVSRNDETENSTYNGWLHEHFCSSGLAFGATGVIIACRLNAPGSWHDSCVAQPIYEKLHTKTPNGYYLVADTAFSQGTDHIQGCIHTPLLSYCQTAKWGMHTMQGSFGRLRVPLQITYHEWHGNLLEAYTQLFNLRTRCIGYNQIQTVYMPIWSANEQEQIWTDFKILLFGEQPKLDHIACFHLHVDGM